MRLKEKQERPNYRAPMAFKADFSWIMSDKCEHASVVFNVNTQYIMISCCGGGNRE